VKGATIVTEELVAVKLYGNEAFSCGRKNKSNWLPFTINLGDIISLPKSQADNLCSTFPQWVTTKLDTPALNFKRIPEQKTQTQTQPQIPVIVEPEIVIPPPIKNDAPPVRELQNTVIDPAIPSLDLPPVAKRGRPRKV